MIDLLEFVENIPGDKPDKYELGYIQEIYNELFTPKKNSCTKVLEIGIQYGLSLLMWKEYFLNADIYGVDIEYCHHVTNTTRVYSYFENAYSKKCVDLFSVNSFDIVIDDGPHTLESMIFFCKHYFNLVKSGGLFIIEDIIDINWTPVLLNILGNKHYVTVYNMAGKCKSESLNAKWKNGLDVIVVVKN